MLITTLYNQQIVSNLSSTKTISISGSVLPNRKVQHNTHPALLFSAPAWPSPGSRPRRPRPPPPARSLASSAARLPRRPAARGRRLSRANSARGGDAGRGRGRGRGTCLGRVGFGGTQAVQATKMQD